jgi:tetratricopeptide (TPR) repeat protein
VNHRPPTGRNSMKRTTILTALVLGGVLLGLGTSAAAVNRGEKALFAQDYDKAIAAFRAQVRSNGAKPSWCDDMLQLAYAHYMIREFPESLAVLDDLLANAERLGGNDIFRVSAYFYWRGRAAFDLGNYQVSADSFARAAEVSPAEIPPNYRSPWVVGLQPVKSYCYSWLAAAQYGLGRYHDSAASRRRAIEFLPKDKWSSEFVALSQACLAGGEIDEALAAAKKALELKPDGEAYQIMGDVLSARRQFAEAVDAYQTALGSDPKSQSLYRSLGQAQFAAGDLEAALATYAKEEETAPGDPEALFQRGAIACRLGRYDEAIATFDDAIRRMTGVNLGIGWNNRDGFWSVDRQAPGDPGVGGPAREAGLKAGDRILKVDGQPTRGWAGEKFYKAVGGEEGGTVVLTFQRPGEPAPFDKTFIRKKNTSFIAARFLGFRSLVYRAKGNREAALKDAEQCLSLDPGNDYGLQAMGALDLDAGSYVEAIGRLSGLKDNPFASLIEATAYARKGDLAKAAEIYGDIPESALEEKAALRQSAKAALLKSLEGYAQASLEKGRAAESAGRIAEALDAYAVAIRISDEATAGLIRQRVAILLKSNPAAAELPEEARKFALRGDILIKEASFAAALAEYRSALEIAPLNPQLHFNTALIHGQLKDYRAAIRSMNVFLQLSPDAAKARAAKDEIYKWEFMLEKEGKK